MKKMMKSILAMAVLLVGIGNLQAQDVKTEKFKVYGNCGMCESRIEKAANSVDGVESADWDKETKILVVKYDSGEVEILDVHKAIAAVGHDTKEVKAEDKSYDELPSCCQYDRKDMMKEDDGHDGHQH
ncbi:MAG: heavy-metal-associated domain-containing protein [Bacteroidales bacterium]|jgi:copper chaperone CopZ|nr:heavy-metal-associated domain-containing protein [Bacteroidales bacterium]